MKQIKILKKSESFWQVGHCKALIEGGTYRLQSNWTFTSQFDIMNNLTLDLNGKNLTINVAADSGIKIWAGVTLTITDTSTGGKLTVVNIDGVGINTNKRTCCKQWHSR